MRNVVPVVALLLALASGPLAHAQTATDLPPLTAVDFTDAEISQAGPEAFYIRNVGLPATDGVPAGSFSILIELDDDGAWQIADVVPEDENLLPPDVVLDYATLTTLDEERLEVDGILLDGQILSGVFDLSATGISRFDAITRRGTFSEREIEYPQTLRDLLLGRRIDEHEQEVARIRSEYEERLSDLQSRYQAVLAERASLQAANEDLVEQVRGLRQENERLRTRVSELETQLEAIAEGGGDVAAPSRGYLSELRALRGEISDLRGQIAQLQALVAGGRSSTAPSLPAAPTGDGRSPAADGATGVDRAPAADGAAAADRGAAVDPGLPADEAPAGPEISDGVPPRTDGEADPGLPPGEAPAGRAMDDGVPPRTGTEGVESPLPYRERTGEAELVPAEDRPPEAAAGRSSTDAAATTEADAAGVSLGAAATEAELRREIARLEARNAELSRSRESLEAEVRRTLLAEGYIAVMSPSLTQTALSGLESATAQLGAWQVMGNRAVQRDPEMLFAKLALPIEQTGQPVLYSFQARSTDPPGEWVGFGIHIYVDDVEKKGYGLGTSLLVWLTRDREVYKTDNTHLQLYRSQDDINMGRVMDAVITDPITGFVDVDVLYEPRRQYVTVAVDGEEKIRYKTWFGINEGVEIALRSLGTAEFRDLTVMTRPGP